jgi:hypothetical protein
VRLKTYIYEGAIDWLRLRPDLIVQPKEQILLRFSFALNTRFNGYLITQTGQGDYREYLLPISGQPYSFGVAPEASKVLSYWNSGMMPATYNFSHKLAPDHTLEPGQLYADIVYSHYLPANAPIEVESWIPYRVRVTSEQQGFVETPRVYMPGYVAKVDGGLAPVLKSNQHLVMIPISPGEHHVEVSYVGTWRLWLALWISALTWIALGLKIFRGDQGTAFSNAAN